jgi:hypothetical protein
VREARIHQRLHLRMQVLRRHDGGGPRVGDVVAQLFGEIHRIDRHHDGVRAQDRVIGQHELRAVLHVEQHAVAVLHAAMDLQPACQALGLVKERGVGKGAVVKDRQRFVRIAPRRDGQVVEQVRLRNGEVMRQALGPGGEMGHWHGGALRERMDSGAHNERVNERTNEHSAMRNRVSFYQRRQAA